MQKIADTPTSKGSQLGGHEMPSQARVLASERQYPLPLAGLALVTGGSGFIGSAVVRCLVGAGISVRAMIRPTSPRANLAGLKIDLVLGDLRDRDLLDLRFETSVTFFMLRRITACGSEIRRK